ncbi:DUF4843 domain-containing protein [Butyricimonas paravirosa]|uniref:DUF4843 domain-containing protein n=1 Tax=Butyricimonas paravirosa TaxID=1472417 RepID=UPI00210A6E15|nr:DUF4843 domain-containing protein [Butyricimonas paravirosa]MCQ4874672.1 DUF4843 domain-containing protein [Butyricimonas paravirosa]
MKKLTIILQLLTMFIFLQSCEEYEMVQYGEGREINFMGDYYLGKGKKPYWVDEPEYLHYDANFGINPLGDSLLMDTILVGVKISGIVADHPRKVVFTTNVPDKNALEVVYPEEYYVPVDTGVAVFQILLKRPATRGVEYTADLTFDYDKSDFKAGTLERQVFKLKVRDEVSMELWGTYEEEWDGYYAMFFGPYSETKARYLITKYGGTILNEWIMTDKFMEILYSNGFYQDFEAYKANPANKPLLDENTGEWIEIPDVSELL